SELRLAHRSERHCGERNKNVFRKIPQILIRAEGKDFPLLPRQLAPRFALSATLSPGAIRPQAPASHEHIAVAQKFIWTSNGVLPFAKITRAGAAGR
ncbi:MAG: hypothetical protein K2M90_08725, partial [Treponemataceae bacterium]|nr:hypothetical protein [Treponemataceae bacterium]